MQELTCKVEDMLEENEQYKNSSEKEKIKIKNNLLDQAELKMNKSRLQDREI